MNQEDKRRVKIGIAISAFAILLYLGLQNVSSVLSGVQAVAGMLSPFFIGICLAFVLNVPLRFIEEKLFGFVNRKRLKWWDKLRRPISVVITVIFFLGIITALVAFVLPQLGDSIDKLVNNLPGYTAQLTHFCNSVLRQVGLDTDITQYVINLVTQFSDTILSAVTNMAPAVVNAVMGITTGLVNAVMGFVLAIYMLIMKESLIVSAKNAVNAFMPPKAALYTQHVYRLVNKRYTGFVAGQLTEAFILGFLCFIGMSLFRMEYALLISVFVGITNVIPFIGPILGAIPGVLIMLMIDPMKAFWFIVFVFILQQVESNFIYPKVVGDSIGLPGLWVIFALLLGGGLFGFVGIILGVPAFAVIYTLLSELIQARLQKRGIKQERAVIPSYAGSGGVGKGENGSVSSMKKPKWKK